MKVYILIPLLFIIACQGRSQEDPGQPKSKAAPQPEAYHPSKAFNDYWYEGEAELTSFKLKQARYGQINEGHATMIFVTEHLDPQSLVKTTENTEAAIPVMKLNFTRKFLTGIYPYSLMTSVFTPVNRQVNGHTLKETFTAQEWCGHQFQMLKWNDGQYDGELRSYFAGEADQNFELDEHLLEDEIWNLVRMGPDHLPEGKTSVIPSLTHLRLGHVDHQPYQATAQLTAADTSINGVAELSKFVLDYSVLDRSLTIYFEADFPHKIIRWEEKVKSGFGKNARELTTIATRKETIKLDYWNKNSNADTTYRKRLGY